ncbi:VOC family protein [Gordonia neofelifaecis]|uniref:Glyoxalase/bleomycin resistance protein/dioxygenase n=1 Tax=Gordonia neofelifaecis NRRL B-59395 TaxID=644548 RepID=F1YHI5_9ACTN|nr:VOC family protein [Gordonia neofelifaecis]EGD55823.1 Glyoxalase/bleomycin resistance protein/dioxygenase [Gordonia neofelifaecis NRRL B-59395]
MAQSVSAAAEGAHTTAGRPRGFTSLTPFLVVSRAAEAIAFYREVFGARIIAISEFGGVIAHAEIEFDCGRMQLGEPNEAYGLVAPPAPDDACYSLAIYTPDVDATVARAEAAGATVREPAADFVSGDRFASIRDPFGVRWSVMTRVVDLSDEESAARVAEWVASQG